MPERQGVLWDGSSEQAKVIVEWVEKHGGHASHKVDQNRLDVRSQAGTFGAIPGWWVVRNNHGDIYAVSPETFEAHQTP